MSRKLLKSTAVVSAMTFLSRAMGFVRDMVLARMFGVAAGTDAFFVAFKIPNLLRRLFAEGAFSQAFVPVLTEYKTQRDHAQIQHLVDHVAGTLGAVLLLITVAGVLLAPILIMLFAPGFIGDENKYELSVSMLRITFPYLFFISLTAFAGGILNSYGKFAVPSFTPVLLNICMIIAAVGFSSYFEQPVMALAWGVFIAGLTQLAFQIPFLWQIKLLPKISFARHHDGVKRIMRLMLPAIFGSSVAQINLLFDTLLASLLMTGSVSWLYYSDRLVEFPLGMIGVALATVILPNLSRRHAEQSIAHFSHMLDWALRWVIVVGVPSTIGLFVLASPILITLFNYGEFNARDVRMSSISLMAYSLGLQAFILVKVLAPGFYARQDTRTPVRIGIIAMLSNMVLNVLFVMPLILWWYEAPHLGLALATSCSAFLNAGLLWRTLKRQGVYTASSGWLPLMLQITLATFAMAMFLYYQMGALETWLGWGAVERITQLSLLLIAAVLVYVVVLVAAGARPWRWRSVLIEKE